MATKDNLSASLEDYLETIFHVVQDKQVARPKEISGRMGVSRSSVTGALHALAERAMVNYAPYDVVTLTEQGRAQAVEIVRRHEVLRDFFVKVLAVESHSADQAACRVEHAVGGEVLERFVQFIDFVENCPRGGASWVEAFSQRCRRGWSPDQCEPCVAGCLERIRNKAMNETGNDGSVLLDSMAIGQKGRIIKFTSAGRIGRRLLEMGVGKGAMVEVERIAPLGDPIEIKVKGYHLSLRKEEAARITVELLQP